MFYKGGYPFYLSHQQRLWERLLSILHPHAIIHPHTKCGRNAPRRPLVGLPQVMRIIPRQKYRQSRRSTIEVVPNKFREIRFEYAHCAREFRILKLHPQNGRIYCRWWRNENRVTLGGSDMVRWFFLPSPRERVENDIILDVEQKSLMWSELSCGKAP